MPGKTRLARTAALLMLFLIAILARAQTVDAALDHYLAQTFSDAAHHPLTVKEWESGRPGETLEAPGDADVNAGSDDLWWTQDKQLQGQDVYKRQVR